MILPATASPTRRRTRSGGRRSTNSPPTTTSPSSPPSATHWSSKPRSLWAPRLGDRLGCIRSEEHGVVEGGGPTHHRLLRRLHHRLLRRIGARSPDLYGLLVWGTGCAASRPAAPGPLQGGISGRGRRLFARLLPRLVAAPPC